MSAELALYYIVMTVYLVLLIGMAITLHKMQKALTRIADKMDVNATFK